MTRKGMMKAVVWVLVFSPLHSVQAQWFDYPTPGIPRNADGSAALEAPTPRAASGVPDLSGIWLAADRLLDECPDASSCIVQMDLPADQRDISRSLPDGLPYQPWAAELVAQRSARQAMDDPHARCLPPNFPRAYYFPQYFKIVQTPGLIVILHEFNASYRQIFLDGRPLPEDPFPYWNGYSIGHWEGDTLVVESLGYRDDLWLDMMGNPITEAARITERIMRGNFGSLDIELTIDDPKAYTKPWTVTLANEAVVDTELIEEICLENEQDVQLFDSVE
jgi:hypothetical protein